MTRWQIKPGELTEHEKGFTAVFECHNLDTGKKVTLTLHQDYGDPASDLVGSCQALAQLIAKTASAPSDDDKSDVARLH